MAVLGHLIGGHAHSQFSWDASDGCMLESCRRGAEMGLGGIAFTEHADLTDWVLPEGTVMSPGWERYLDGQKLRLPPLDVEAYRASIEECQRRYPGLGILSGVKSASLTGTRQRSPICSPEPASIESSAQCMPHPSKAARARSRPYSITGPQAMSCAATSPRSHDDSDRRGVRPGEATLTTVAVLADRQGPLRSPGVRGGASTCLGRACRERRRPGDQHASAARSAHPHLVGGGRRTSGHIWQRLPHAPQTIGAGLHAAAELAASRGFQPSASPIDPWRRARR